jgi:leader peptidase (prepilin peptidase)/N-methyltransferase
MILFFNTFETITGLPNWFGFLFIFLMGTIIGSFLNVVIHRVPLEESVIFPNSACPKCNKNIKSYDNIPILSWIFLGGKCRNCQNPISIRYPAIELLTGLLFILTFWQIGFNFYLPVVLIFNVAMICLIFIDAEHMILPDVITLPLFIFSFLIRLIFPIVLGNAIYFTDLSHYPVSLLHGQPLWLVSIVGGILGGLAGGGSLWLIGEIWKRFRGVEAMGFGDVKMMFGVGMLLGWRLTFLSIFLGAFTGALAGIGVIAGSKDKDMQAKIPFGIFLGIGSIIAILFGDNLVVWYLQNFVPN